MLTILIQEVGIMGTKLTESEKYILPEPLRIRDNLIQHTQSTVYKLNYACWSQIIVARFEMIGYLWQN